MRDRALFVGVGRERRYSPGKIQDDAAILAATATELRDAGEHVRLVDPDEGLPEGLEPAIVFAMCQGEEALSWLDRLAGRAPIANAPRAIRACHRRAMLEALTQAGVAQPAWEVAGPSFPTSLGPAPWLKRADVHAMDPADVRRVYDEREWRAAHADLSRRGIAAAIVQAHLEGPVYKFYGVTGGFFRAFGLPDGHAASAARAAEAAARALGLEVYGGDGVAREDGSVALIDVNDWPSFSRCRGEAAAAIARRLLEIREESVSHDSPDEGGSRASRSSLA